MSLIDDIKAWFNPTPGGEPRLRVEVSNDNAIVIGDEIATVADTELINVTSGAEVEITAAANQKDISIINVDGSKIHFSFKTGVSTANASIQKDDEQIEKNCAASIFVIRAASNGNIQVSRKFKL